MAFNWANVLVAPTGSTGLDTGSHASIDEPPPWSDADLAVETVPSGTSETAIFSGIDLSNAGGEDEGYQVWSRMRTSSAAFGVTITVKQAGVTLSTLPTFTVSNTASRTFLIEIPDADMAGQGNNALSLEFLLANLGGNSTFSFSWVAMSKSPFTNAQKAELPPALTGQEFVCYRYSDLGVLGAVDGEAVVLLPDASGKGRHSVLRAGTFTYETDGEAGLAPAGRFVGTLGYDPATDAEILWSGNKIFHAQVYPSTDTDNGAVFSVANASDFIGTLVPDRKHLMSSSGGFVLMSGDGSAEAHLNGGVVPINELIRVTEWIQVGGGDEHMWENDDASPIVDGSSGDNAFNTWSIGNRETDDRPFLGRIQEVWFIEGTGITEAELDTARDQWVAGFGNPDPPDPPDPPSDSETDKRIGGTGAIRRGGAS